MPLTTNVLLILDSAGSGQLAVTFLFSIQNSGHVLVVVERFSDLLQLCIVIIIMLKQGERVWALPTYYNSCKSLFCCFLATKDP